MVSSRWAACTVRFKGASILFVEMYLHHGQGLAGDSMAVLAAVAMVIKMHNMPVVLCADWQEVPSVVSRSTWIDRMGLVVIEPTGEFTCRSTAVGGHRVIDFFAISQSLVDCVVESSVRHDVPWGPHSAVQLTMRKSLRQLHAPTLVVPKLLPDISKLDFDEASWEQAQAELQRLPTYSRFLQQTEDVRSKVGRRAGLGSQLAGV